jgi:hypothetical protein
MKWTHNKSVNIAAISTSRALQNPFKTAELKQNLENIANDCSLSNSYIVLTLDVKMCGWVVYFIRFLSCKLEKNF